VKGGLLSVFSTLVLSTWTWRTTQNFKGPCLYCNSGNNDNERQEILRWPLCGLGHCELSRSEKD